MLPPARITVLLHLQVRLTRHVISKHVLEIESWDLEDHTLLSKVNTLTGREDVALHLSLPSLAHTFSYGWLKFSGQFSTESSLVGRGGTSPSY